MKAFVTGGTGMLGNNLVRELVGQGHEVRVLVRSEDKAERLLGGLGVEFVRGDMTNVWGFAPALGGVDVLFHTAAYFRETFAPGDHWPKLEQINVTNTTGLFHEAERSGVEKIVHTSSVASIRKREDGRVSDEGDLASAQETPDLYGKSKVLGDAAIARFTEAHDTPVITVKPAWMIGPWDAAPKGGGQFVLDFLNRSLPVVLDSGIEVVDARDVARVLVAAAEHGEGGESYIATAHQASQAELMAALESVTDVPATTRRVPVTLALAAAWANERVAALTGRESSLSVNGVRSLTRKMRASAAKAERELGATFRPLEETMRDAAAWYLEHQPEKVKDADRVRAFMQYAIRDTGTDDEPSPGKVA